MHGDDSAEHVRQTARCCHEMNATSGAWNRVDCRPKKVRYSVETDASPLARGALMGFLAKECLQITHSLAKI